MTTESLKTIQNAIAKEGLDWQAAATSVSQLSAEQQKDLLQTVHRQGSLLNNLIQELLDLSRIEARQGKDFHIVPTALPGIVEAALNGIANRELGRQVQIGAIPELSVMADASKIEQALVNLLSNAIKYSPQGGEVSVSVKDSVAFYERNTLRVRDELETLARNEAPGLQADTLQALGDPADGEQRFAAYRCGR
mgnify:CR=1 FL=1